MNPAAQRPEDAPWPDGETPPRRGDDKPVEDGDRALIVDVDGFEGPLDLLLSLARDQKVDLARISVLQLAEQYLAFISAMRRMRIELAADYLVMAAWLAYLKSRLLLPDPEPEEEPAAEELAARLAFRLQRLQAMRDAAEQLMARPQLGREVFARGMPEPVVVETRTEYEDTLFDLIKAYAERRQRAMAHKQYTVHRRVVWSLKEARESLERLMGKLGDWGRLDSFLMDYLSTPETRATVLASSLGATLEMAREGLVEIRQDKAFAPIYLRRRADAPAADGGAASPDRERHER